MTDVGVRELEQHLSEYLERAEKGEVVTVTDRGRPKATLGPLPGRAGIDRGVEEGWITPGSGAPLADLPRSPSERSVLDVLGEDRGE